MISRINLLFIFFVINFLLISQTNSNHIPGTSCSTCAWSVPAPPPGKSGSGNSVFNGNSTIATSYTQTACGLNFTQCSHPLYKRGFSFALGVNQPATYAISGIPPCAVILKAYLYVGTSGTGVAITANVTNPASASSAFPMALIGTAPDKCWSYSGTYTYRADVTPIISGNGNYIISGIPVSPAADDADGATLFIIYSDPTQNYTGSIVIADGAYEVSGGTANATISGFNVCGGTSSTTNFMIVADLQQIANTNVNFNSAATNFVKSSATDQVWDYITAPGTAAASGQTSAMYGLTNTSDCFNLLMAGMYYQSTCLTCPLASGALTVNATSTPSCPTSNATVTATGGTAPYSYTWTPSAQSTSVATGLSSGSYTVIVKDATGCLTGSATVNVSTAPLTPITVNSGTICQGFSTNLTASGATSYTWSPGASLNTTNGPNVTANPAATQIYTITSANALGCIGTQTTQVTVNPTPTISTSNVTVCAGQILNITANSLAGSVYSWTGPAGFTSSAQNPSLANATTGMSGAYNLTVTSSSGCTNTAVSNVTVTGLPVPAIGSNAPICANNNLNLTGSGGASYSWQGPNGFTSLLQNPTITGASTLATGVYTLTAANGACSASTTSLITINPLPSPTLTSNSPVCNGLALNLNGSGGNTYSWSGPAAFSSTSQNPVINPASPANSGVYTLTAISVNGCTATTTSPITINPTPTISITGATVCLNTTINLSSNSLAGSTYSWSGPLAFSSNAQNPTIPNATIPMSGVYSLTVTSAVGCVNTATTNVSVLTLPSPAISSNAPVCVGSVLTLTAGGGLTYQWNGPNGFTSTSANPTINNITLAGSGTYSLIASIGTCTASTTQAITVNALPTPTATNNSAICNGQTLNLNTISASSYTWTGPSTFASSIQAPAIASATPSNSGIYTVTVTDVNGCKNSATTSVTVNPTPTITTVGSTVCVGQSATLNSNSLAGSAYLWSGPNSFNSASQNVTLTNAQTVMSGIYNLTVTSAVGCTNTANATISVLALPTPTITSNTPCAGGILSLNVTGATGATFSWSGPNAFTSTLQNPTINNVTLAANGIYSVTASAGICSATVTKSVTINALPVPTATNNSPICETKNLILAGLGGVSFSWSGPNAFTSALQSPTITNVFTAQGGIYALTVTDANGCQASTSTSVTILTNPAALANGATVCYGTTATLSAVGGASYSWTGPNSFTSNSSNPVIPVANNITSGNYMVTVTGVNTCTSIAVANVTTNPLPVPSITSTPRACLNTLVSLQGTPGYQIYQWTGPNNYLSAQANTSFTTSSLSQAGTYVLGVTDNNGCTGFTSTVVTIDPFPTANLLSDNNKHCVPFCSNFTLQATSSASLVSTSWTINGLNFSGNTLNYCMLTAGKYIVHASFVDANGCPNNSNYTVTAYPVPKADFAYTPTTPIENVDDVLFNDGTQGDSLKSWSWFFNNNDNHSSYQNPSYLFTEAGAYAVAMVVKNVWGCTDTIVKSITVGEDFSFFVPNAFTPNGDGINDTFFPKGHAIVKYDMAIFDRWGEKLFTTNDFSHAWDGTYKGSNCKDDVYVWKINVTMPNSKVKTYTGHVTINR